jgi:hypothetical protein
VWWINIPRNECHHTLSECTELALRPAKSTVHLVLPLALGDEIVAMTAQEGASWPIQDRKPPAPTGSRTDEPRPLPSEVARRPAQGHGLPYIFPFSAWTASVLVC